MNSKEIKEALEIIKKPIKVNCIEYKYFDDENYNKLIEVYDNCLWFANNLEQINLTVENLQKENQKLKEQLQQKEDIINKVKEFVKKHNERAGKLYYKYDNKYLLSEIREDLLKILDNKGE